MTPDLFDAAEAMRVAMMLAEDAKGFDGRFFFDYERGDIAYLAKDCDLSECDCPSKTNNDGDQDCSIPIGGAGGVDECVGVPVACMLNNARSAATQLRAACEYIGLIRDVQQATAIAAVETTADRDRLADEVERLRGYVGKIRHRREADDGIAHHVVNAVAAERDSLAAEVDQMRAHIATLEAAASATAQWRADAAVRETAALNEARRLRGLCREVVDIAVMSMNHLDRNAETKAARLAVIRAALETKETP